MATFTVSTEMLFKKFTSLGIELVHFLFFKEVSHSKDQFVTFDVSRSFEFIKLSFWLISLGRSSKKSKIKNNPGRVGSLLYLGYCSNGLTSTRYIIASPNQGKTDQHEHIKASINRKEDGGISHMI
ncbi:hypothetical protein RND71_026685 [Anisodus tanguticus]|uniref:Uncharacterized protein n=1 Tax=Anisodus tanguticus TaxID=243964 RepID=A0AAE1V8J0_9SOLA|nr:hypothetical protein RND71_026685 [Anisodus tanguticus]